MPDEPRRAHDGADFVSRVIAIVEAIPAGRVMSYSDVAAAIHSRAARGVGSVMARYGADLPWWRVVRASGEPATDHAARALEHYRSESTPLVQTRADTYRVNMAMARHLPHRDRPREHDEVLHGDPAEH